MDQLGLKLVTCIGTELLIYELDLDDDADGKKRESFLSFLNKDIVAWLKGECVKQVRAVLAGNYLIVMVSPATPPWEEIPGFNKFPKQKPTKPMDILLEMGFGHQECKQSEP